MDKPNISTPVMPANGIYVLGVIVSNRAKAFQRKDGSGVSVVVEHEIALQPGVCLAELSDTAVIDSSAFAFEVTCSTTASRPVVWHVSGRPVET